MSIRELVDGGRGLRIAGRCIEPTVSAEQLLAAIPESEVESLRPLLPVGYDAVAESYRRAAASISTDDLTRHYTQGIDSFHLDFVPWLRECLGELSGGQWNLEDYQAFAAGSDCDFDVSSDRSDRLQRPCLSLSGRLVRVFRRVHAPAQHSLAARCSERACLSLYSFGSQWACRG